jgi:hypothetical protein
MPAVNEAEAPVEAAMTRERKEGRTKRARARGGLAWPRRVELGGGPRRVERRAELRFSAWEEKGERGRCSVRRSGDFSCAWKEKGDEGVFYPFLFVRLPGINFVRGHVVIPLLCKEFNLQPCARPCVWNQLCDADSLCCAVACGLWPVGWVGCARWTTVEACARDRVLDCMYRVAQHTHNALLLFAA